MNQKVRLILLLISISTIGLIVFQVYWNYTLYTIATNSFREDINDVLQQAIDQEAENQNRELLLKYESWLRDSNLISIGLSYHKGNEYTTFTISDKNQKNVFQRRPYNIGFQDSNFQGKIDSISPKIKNQFISNFLQNIIKEEIKQSKATYYTQQLGDSLTNELRKSRVNLSSLTNFYNRLLQKTDINTNFTIDTGSNIPVKDPLKPYSTNVHKAGIKSNQISVSARFSNPELVILVRMKWLLLSSLVLIIITITCFAYTVSTLLSQTKLSQLKNDFVNNITHELKTPVSTISVAAEAIQSFNLNEVDKRDYLNVIRSQASNLSYLIDQILNSALAETSKIQLNFTINSLKEIITYCIQQYEPQLKHCGANLEVILEGNPLFVKSDRVHLTNVFANLLDNAIKYSYSPPKIIIQTKVNDQLAIVRVTNYGKEIKEEYKQKIFEKFYRIPEGNTHSTKGYGLGLQYVRNIIKQHGGKITLETNAVSNTFIIYLPLSK